MRNTVRFHDFRKSCIAFLALLCLSFSGCERVPEFWNIVDHDHSALQDEIDAFFDAVDRRDAEAIKGMFSANALRDDPDMDEMIGRLFALYQNPTDDCYMEESPGSSRKIGKKRFANTHGWFPVVSNNVNYYCYISYTYRDDEDPGNIGLEALIFVTEKVRCNEDFRTGNGWKALGSGLTVVEDAPGDYLTCRIGTDPFIYTPVDRVITQEDIVSFLEKTDRWDDFMMQFGEPNAVSPYSSGVCYYELKDESGEKRYAYVSRRESDSGEKCISSVVLMNGTNAHALDVLWRYEDEA